MVTTKLVLLSVVAISLVSGYIFHTAKTRTLELPRSPLAPALISFGVAMLISSLLSGTYPVENLLGVGGGLIAFTLIILIGSLLIKGRSNQDFMAVFNSSVIILGVLTLLQTFGFGPSRLINSLFGLTLPNTSLFNLAGSPFVAVQVFGLAFLANVVALIKQRRADTLRVLSIAVAGIGLALNLWLILPGKEASPLLLPIGVSWTIAIDVLKAPRTALIGVGPENYSAAYQQLRPVWTNSTTWWSSTFGQAANVPLTLLATTGLLGLLAWAFFFLRSFNFARTQFAHEPALATVVITALLLQLVLPLNMVLLAILASALAFLLANHQGKKTFSIHLFRIEKNASSGDSEEVAQPHFLFSFLPFVLSGVVLVAGLYGIGRAQAASYTFFQSSLSLQKNDAVKTYELQQTATQLNPYLPILRSNFALTNLAIATALSNKTDATEAEKQQVGQLIQQAIREARAATLLRPQDSQTWQTLAQIYRSLIGSAEGADQWASSAYVQAISLNPNDPHLRIELGSLLFSQQKFGDANLLFKQAAELKPDLPNAYYNWANGLRATGELEAAKLTYQKTLTLLPANSDDYTKVNQELESLEKEIETTNKKSDSTKTGSAAPTTTPAQESVIPSIVNQNLSQSDESVVTRPSATELNVPQPQTPTTPVAPSSPTPSPTL